MGLRTEWERQRVYPSGQRRWFAFALFRWTGHYVQRLHALAGVLLSVGLVLALAGLWGVSRLTEEVLEGDTVELDGAVLLWLNQHATPRLDQLAVQVTALGDTLVLTVLTIVVASLLWAVGRRSYTVLLMLAVGGAAIMTPVLKTVFDRPRPQLFEWRAHYEPTSLAYPSGHATMSMVTFIVIAFILYRTSANRSVSLIGAVVAALLIGVIGLSRLYLGVHYPSDVVAGYVVGFAWATLCAVVVETMQNHSLQRATAARARPDVSSEQQHESLTRKSL